MTADKTVDYFYNYCVSQGFPKLAMTDTQQAMSSKGAKWKGPCAVKEPLGGDEIII